MTKKYNLQRQLLTDRMFRRRFGYSQEDYDQLVVMGLPLIKIGGLTRIDVEEAKDWASENHILLTDAYQCLTRKDLKTFLSVDGKTISNWIRMGLKTHRKTVRGILREFFYVEEVMEFIEEQRKESVV